VLSQRGKGVGETRKSPYRNGGTALSLLFCGKKPVSEGENGETGERKSGSEGALGPSPPLFSRVPEAAICQLVWCSIWGAEGRKRGRERTGKRRCCSAATYGTGGKGRKGRRGNNVAAVQQHTGQAAERWITGGKGRKGRLGDGGGNWRGKRGKAGRICAEGQ
jgi:hypothetical protein